MVSLAVEEAVKFPVVLRAFAALDDFDQSFICRALETQLRLPQFSIERFNGDPGQRSRAIFVPAAGLLTAYAKDDLPHQFDGHPPIYLQIDTRGTELSDWPIGQLIHLLESVRASLAILAADYRDIILEIQHDRYGPESITPLQSIETIPSRELRQEFMDGETISFPAVWEAVLHTVERVPGIQLESSSESGDGSRREILTKWKTQEDSGYLYFSRFKVAARVERIPDDPTVRAELRGHPLAVRIYVDTQRRRRRLSSATLTDFSPITSDRQVLVAGSFSRSVASDCLPLSRTLGEDWVACQIAKNLAVEDNDR